MIKEKKILSYFIGWLILGLFICFVGVSDVFADEMERVGFLSDKSEIKVVVPYNGQPLTLDQYGEYMLTDVDELLIFIDNYSFSRDNIYQLELYLPNATLTNANIFSVSGSNSNNNNVSCRAIKILQDNKQYVNFRWSCSENVDNLAFTITNSNNENIVKSGIFKWDYTFLWNVLSTEDNSDIINGLDNIQQSIIDSNKETQNVIKDQFNTCRDSVNLLNFNKVVKSNSSVEYEILDTGIRVYNTTPGTYRNVYIDTDILPSGTYTLNKNINVNSGIAYILVQSVDGTTQNIINSTKSGPITFNLETNSVVRVVLYSTRNTSEVGDVSYTNLQLQKGSVFTKYEPYGEEICTNKLDETNDALNNIGGALTDDSPTDMSGLGDSAGWLPSGPVDSILTLPLTLFTTLSDNLSNNTCTTAILTLPFVKKNINLPCIKTLYDKIGITGTLFTTAGIIASCFILFNYLLSLYNWVDKTLTMRENTMPGYYDDNWGGGA